MNMTQLVIGTACGFLLAQGALYGVRRLIGVVRSGDLVNLVSRLRSLRPAPSPNFISAFVKYAAPVGISAALVTFGVWAVSDYLAARSARTAAANAFDSSTPPPPEGQAGAAVARAALTPPPPLEPVEESAAPGNSDPYADPDFKVQRKAHRAGTSLKEVLVERSETRARNDLLRELQQHSQRSQYDCEAAARAARYLQAGLDVWGFAAWQVKYFPADNFRGSTLEQCKDIKNVVAALDLQAAVAQQTAADSEH